MRWKHAKSIGTTSKYHLAGEEGHPDNHRLVHLRTYTVWRSSGEGDEDDGLSIANSGGTEIG